MSKNFHSLDLDGNLTDIDIFGAFDGTNSREVLAYVMGAATHIAEKTGLLEAEVFEGLKQVILEDVFPRRGAYEHWAVFPDTDKNDIRIFPAVDHFVLTQVAVPIFLRRQLSKEGKRSKRGARIREFLSSPWVNSLFRYASDASLPHAEISEDGVESLQYILQRDDPVAVITNSTTKKAKIMLEKAGFGSRLVEGDIQPGKIGVIGDARKFEVDTSMSCDGNIIDLSAYYGSHAIVDIRRGHFRRLARGLFERSGAASVIGYSDVVELDLLPLRAEFGEQVRLGMKTNTTSLHASVRVARRVANAQVAMRLSVLVKKLQSV